MANINTHLTAQELIDIPEKDIIEAEFQRLRIIVNNDKGGEIENANNKRSSTKI